MVAKHVCWKKDANFGIFFLSKTELFHVHKKKQNNLIVVWRKQMCWVAFFLFQKRIFIHVDCSNIHGFGIARMQTNFNKFKRQNDGKWRASCVILLQKWRNKQETKLNPQLSFWQVDNKSCVFAIFEYRPAWVVTFLEGTLRLRDSYFCTERCLRGLLSNVLASLSLRASLYHSRPNQKSFLNFQQLLYESIACLRDKKMRISETFFWARLN